MGRTVTQGCPNGAGSARKHAPSNVEATPCSLFQLISAYAYTREGFTRNASSAFNVDGGRTNVPSPFRTNVNRASFPMPMTISSRGWLRVASEYLRRQSRVNESVPRAFVRNDGRRSVPSALDAFALSHRRKYCTFLLKIPDDRGHGEGKTLAHESE